MGHVVALQRLIDRRCKVQAKERVGESLEHTSNFVNQAHYLSSSRQLLLGFRRYLEYAHQACEAPGAGRESWTLSLPVSSWRTVPRYEPLVAFASISIS